LPIDLTSRAREDLRDIQLYGIRQWGEDQADAYEADIMQALDTLERNPRVGRVRDDLRRGLRSYPVRRHVIVYQIDEEAIVVLRIVHASMDLRRQLQE
jgi:toxin ParE1/3/4